jgi:DNA-binding transcriptional regulator LsrR (DeoR family)
MISAIMNSWKDSQLTDAELKTTAQVARLYYIEQWGQQEIAKELEINQPQVSKYLKMAEEHKVVVHVINPFFTENLKQRLEEKFPHTEVILTPFGTSPKTLLKDMGKTAAQFLQKRITHNAKLGVSGGVTLITAIEALGEEQDLPVSCNVYPLIITMNPRVVAINPAVVALALIRWLPLADGIVFELPPTYVTRGGKKIASVGKYETNPEIIKLRANIEQLDYYLIGIGFIDYDETEPRKGQKRYVPSVPDVPTIEFNSLIHDHKLLPVLKENKVVGEVLYQPITSEGESLIDKKAFKPIRDCMFYLPLNVLQNHVQKQTAKVIAVAGGKLKHEAIRAALHAKLFNVLITDAETVEAILKVESATQEN